MDFKTALLLALSTHFVCAAARTTEEDAEYREDLAYLTTVIEEVPETDRRQFLIHQLYLGYVLTHPNDVIIPVSTNVTLKLYELFLRNFIKSPVDLQLMNTVCFPSGECVDVNDPGVVP